MLIAKRYELKQELGRGGMGVVYEAYDRLTQQSVALKRVNTTLSKLDFNSKTDDDSMLSLAHEFRILAGLRHPNIIPVLDYGFNDEKYPFFTMQLLDAPQAFFEVAQNTSLEHQVDFFIQILQALSYLHQHGIIHRDLKPANVLVQDNQVYVLDFGLSVVADVAKGRAGTVAFMAPEVVRHARATKQSDLFAVGVMLYKLITGELPYSMLSIMGMDPFVLENDAISEHPLELVILRLLSEHPHDRYPSAHAAIQALREASDIAAPIEDERIRESFLQTAPFIGRETELGILETALTSLHNNNGGSIWLVGGESGVGKSRLMEEVRIRALTEGIIVIRGRGVEGGGLPYQLWREPLRRLILSTELDSLAASVLKEVIPDIASLLGKDITSAPQLAGKAHQQRLVSTIANVFQEQEQPILLILEDLQWATESLEALKKLSQLIHKLPLLIIGNYRDDERPDIPNMIPNSQSLILTRLSQEEMTLLSASMLGEAGTAPQVLDLLQRETEGNVFFLVEVVRALAEAAGSRSHIGEMTLPQTVFAGGIQAIIQRRLEKVPERYHSFLQLAAVAGRELNQSILEFILSSQQRFAQEEMQEFLLTCANAAVFEVQDGQWQFRHDKLREQLLADLNHEQRKTLHQQIAEAIEALYPSQLQSYAATLTQHWHWCGNQRKELHYAQLTGEQAANTSAYHEAISYFERALALVTELDARALHVNLLIQIGETFSRLGSYERARASLEEGLTLAKVDKNDEICSKALSVLGGIIRDQGDFDEARIYLQESLGLARKTENKVLMAEILLELGWLDHRQAFYHDAYQRFSESVKIYQELDYWRGLATAYNRLGGAALKLEDYASSIELRQKSLELCRQLGDRWGEATALANLGETARLQKDYPLARQYYLDALQIERSIDAQQLTAIVLGNLGYVDLATGDYERAIHYFKLSLKIGLNIRATPLILHDLVGLSHVWVKEHQEAHAIELLQIAMKHPALMGESQDYIDTIITELPSKLQHKLLNPEQEFEIASKLEILVTELLDEFEEEI